MSFMDNGRHIILRRSTPGIIADLKMSTSSTPLIAVLPGHSGAHLEAASANVIIYNSIFTNSHVGMNGGAIQNNSVMTIISTMITGNTASGSGDGISSTGSLTVTNSRICANTAQQGGADIASGVWATLILSDSLSVAFCR